MKNYIILDKNLKKYEQLMDQNYSQKPIILCQIFSNIHFQFYHFYLVILIPHFLFLLLTTGYQLKLSLQYTFKQFFNGYYY